LGNAKCIPILLMMNAPNCLTPRRTEQCFLGNLKKVVIWEKANSPMEYWWRKREKEDKDRRHSSHQSEIAGICNCYGTHTHAIHESWPHFIWY
jgi:hypothetical protein